MSNKQRDDGDWNWGWHGGQSWLPGVVLILIGVVFLLQNYTDFDLDNWWALFILFPAVGNFSTAYAGYKTGGFSRSVRAHAFWGLFFVLLSLSFLFGLEFGLLWPAFLILGGLGMLLGAL
jgi:hypothetical protein